MTIFFTKLNYKEVKMNENELEKEIQDKKLNAPRLTPQLIDSKNC